VSELFLNGTAAQLRQVTLQFTVYIEEFTGSRRTNNIH